MPPLRPAHCFLAALVIVLSLGCQVRRLAPAASGTGDSRPLFEALEDSLLKAILSPDTVVLGQLWAPEYLSTSAVGHTSSRSESLMAYGGGLVHVDSAQIGNLDIRRYGQAGVVLGLMRWGGQAAGRPFGGTVRFQHVWVQQADRTWQLVASQLTGQPPAAAP